MDGVLTRISESGDLLYSTYFGLEGWDSLLEVNMDEEGRLVVSGFVDSDGFETVNVTEPRWSKRTILTLHGT